VQLLKSRAGDLAEFLRRLEERKGVSGYTVVQSELEKVSALKQRIDESKGATLNEISRIVDDINAVRPGGGGGGWVVARGKRAWLSLPNTTPPPTPPSPPPFRRADGA
jgi:hypothetical protein